MTEEQRIAERLHSLLCKLNHTDQCGWFHFPHSWEEYSHRKFLKMAQALIEMSNGETIAIIRVLDAILEVNR